MDHQLRVNVARCATARAHLAGAEAMALREQAEVLMKRADAAKRRYWREVAFAQSLTIGRQELAEQLGAEP